MAAASSATDTVHTTIQNLERDYSAHKAKFDQWKTDNAALSGHESYNKYVEQFVNWEKGVLEQLNELKKSAGNVVRQPAMGSALSSSMEMPQQLPMVDLDTQLNDALRKAKPADFMVAFFAMAQKDQDFLPKVFQVIHRETKGTGFYNTILPQTSNVISSHLPPAPSLYSTPPPMVMQGASYGHGSPNNLNYMGGAVPATSSYSLPGSYSQMSYSPAIRYTQATPYGNIPADWAIQPPIHKRQRPPSPTREYQNPTNVPYKDFSYGNSLL